MAASDLCDGARRDILRHDAASPDHAAVPDGGHDHGGTGDPDVFTNVDDAAGGLLKPNRAVLGFEAVGVLSDS